MNVVVTELEYKKAESIFSTAEGMDCIAVSLEEDRLAASINSYKAKHAIVGTQTYSGALYDALPKDGVIARFGVAHDGIDKDKVKTSGLYCTNTPGVLSNSVAELTMSYVLMAVRHTVSMTMAMKQNHWSPVIGSELLDKTLAVIGCGAIGCRVAQIASFGFQMKVLGYDIRELDEELMKRDFGFHCLVNSLSEAVDGADFVSFHVPLTETTKHFVDSKKLETMPERVWLINTSRGAIMDERLLYDALKSGSIAGAALDVFENEPYRPLDESRDLRALENVILTPHAGTTTREASNRMAERCLQNILFAESGQYEKMDIVAGPE